MFQDIVENEYDGADEYEGDSIPNYCVEVPRILLTPTRVAVHGFDVEMSNRVIRKFVTEDGVPPERFLRVTVADENGDKLMSDDLGLLVESRMTNMILQGIMINGRRYHFLAYSSSQLKEASLWMVCPMEDWNVGRIRQWMGDFSSCKTPSKYAARMGQCFSTTIQALPGQDRNQKRSSLFNRSAGRLRVDDQLDDIDSGDSSELKHSDGAGLIRREQLTEAVKMLPFGPRDPLDVSIIQIRFGGAKGTLTAWDFGKLKRGATRALSAGDDSKEFTLAARPYDVLLRPSMVKFKSPYTYLEVVSVGSHIPYYLNRNVILLLGVHNVDNTVFLNMQRHMLDELDSILTDARKAAELIPCLGGPDSGLVSTLAHAMRAGLSPSDDPFLFSCAHAIRSHHLTNLRRKSRIHVRKGAVFLEESMKLD
jgi:RNA-dependent RNA polymerase